MKVNFFNNHCKSVFEVLNIQILRHVAYFRILRIEMLVLYSLFQKINIFIYFINYISILDEYKLYSMKYLYNMV